MYNIDWPLIDRLIQWLILPAIAWLWALQTRATDTERSILRVEGEIARLLTVLEERERRRVEDREEFAEAVKELKAAITGLSAKLDQLRFMATRGSKSVTSD
jgi:ribosomal protein L29